MILYRLSDFIEGNVAISESSPSYYYEGRCHQTGELLRLPRTGLVEAIAYSLMQQLANNDVYASEGKMYGVLLVELPNGEQRILKAFSGLLNGNSIVEGWVPPIPGRDEVALQEAYTLNQLENLKQELINLHHIPERQQYEILSREFEAQLQAMSDRHKQSKQQRDEKRQQLAETLTGEELAIAIEQLDRESRLQGIERRRLKRQRDEALDPLKQLITQTDLQMRELKQQRKAISRQLQTQMHAAYSLTNFSGQSLSLQELMPGGSMPTGTGDCCAPKLLHYAAAHTLKPLAMAEFWWGLASANQDKVQGQFYGACAERCQPLMGFLLSGTSHIAINPQLLPNTTENLESQIECHHKQLKTENQPTLSEGVWGTRPSPNGGFGGRPPKSGFYTTRLETFTLNCPEIIYEDEWLIAVNKPPGLLSVPGRYLDRQDSVLSRLRHLLPDGMALIAVHRLDRETSGILLLAKDKQTYCQLSQQFQQRQVRKVYEAILSGSAIAEQGAIALPLWGDPENRPYQQVDWERGKPSLTHFQAIATEGDYTRVEFVPLTGRTHQLRVHAADSRGLGVPILGDRLYGCCAVANRLHLHARELSFQHPQSAKILQLKLETPF